MSISRRFVIALAAVLPVATTTLFTVADASPAWAGKAAAGSVSCQASGGISTSSPISEGGTPGKKLDVKLTTRFDGCENPGDPSFPSSPQAVTLKSIKLPDTLVDGQKVVGRAADFGPQISGASTKAKVDWGPSFKPTKAVLDIRFDLPPDPCVGSAEACEAALQFTSISSSDGPLDFTEFFDAASTNTFNGLLNGTMGPTNTFNFDARTSAGSKGPAVLTYGSLSGSNVAVGATVNVTGFSVTNVCSGPSSGQGIVLKNPAAPGTATIEIDTLTVNGCYLSAFGAIAVTPRNLPYQLSWSDAAGDPGTLSDLNLRLDYTAFGTPSTCFYDGTNLSGNFSNSTNTASANATLNLFAGIGDCLSSISNTASVGPFVDQTVAGAPPIFVN